MIEAAPISTGNGTIMLSPNLYTDGKVCMSVLNNTETDHRDQRWVKGTSHLGQVVLAIQSQLLVNKPGSEEYVREKRAETLRWGMAEVMRIEVAGGGLFEKEVTAHFRALAKEVKSKALAWTREEEKEEQAGGKAKKARMERAAGDVLEWLKRLEQEEEEEQQQQQAMKEATMQEEKMQEDGKKEEKQKQQEEEAGAMQE